MTTAWAHLPNAAHIDRVLVHLKQHPDRWDPARDAARDPARDAAWGAVRDAARDAAWDAAWDAARDAIRDAIRDAVGDVVWYAVGDAIRDAVWYAAWDGVMALIAWDDCAYLLDRTPDFLRGCINLTGDHKATLLLPAVIAMKET